MLLLCKKSDHTEMLISVEDEKDNHLIASFSLIK